MRRKEINIGDRFGKLTIIHEVEPNVTPCGTIQRKFLCKCDCGNQVVRNMQTLLKGAKTSCGCNKTSYIQKYFKKESKSFLYSTWSGMRQRCNNPNSASYSRYGGRGISVCDEWDKDFFAFEKWAKENGAKKGLTIDRINNDGNYCPDNCRWVDLRTQANNKRTNRIIEYNGESHTTIEWARITGIQEGTIRSRLRYGYSIGQALGYEEYRRKNPPKYVTYNGETHNLTEWEHITGISRKVISTRLMKGLNVAQALGLEPYQRRRSSYVAPTKKVLEYDLNGNFMKEWESASLAAKHYGASSTAIRYACNGITHSSCNRIWKYKE